MTKPTPTEEQRETARDHTWDEQWGDNDARAEALAALLAEREAPLRERAEKAERHVDCGQEGVCAVTPGCSRHWSERNGELVRERDAAIARAEKAEMAARVAEARAEALTLNRDAALADVARLTAERDEYRAHFGSVAHGRAAFDEKRTALAASRAEVEALRGLLCEGEFLVGFAEHLARTLDPSLIAVDKLAAYAARHRAALSSTPAPASAEPSTRPTRPAGLPPTETVFGVLMAQSQQIKAGVDASAEPATPTTFAGRQMCNMTNCGGSVEMYWTAAYSKQGKCSRCNCAVQCSTTEAGPLATPTTEGGAK